MGNDSIIPTTLVFGAESGATYAVKPINLCTGPAAGEAPNGRASAAGRWRLIYSNGTEVRYLYQAP